ncbi:MAG TPA: ribbon-helix-helix protein, CopG family [Bryobacteraceae bacterium]|nr:ribbon-helix-helix protein, CopG family [Bryobacteraceae bacterium]
MRTTIDLPDDLIREVKAVAARRGTSLKTVIRAALEEEIRKTERKAGRRVKFPLLASDQPGSLNLTNADIEDLSA